MKDMNIKNLSEEKKRKPSRWVPGQSGNPEGRTPGVDRVRQLLNPHRESLVQKAVDLALTGDTVALRICMDRIAPLLRAELSAVHIPGIAEGGSMSDKARAVVDAVGSGLLSPDTAALLLGAMCNATRIIEGDELAARIARLEASSLL